MYLVMNLIMQCKSVSATELTINAEHQKKRFPFTAIDVI